MEKIRTEWKLPPLSLPVALLGATVNGKPNFFTISWFNMLQDDPPLISAGMSKTHYTRQGIHDNKTFSINIPSSHMAEIVDYCGLYSGSNVDKSSLFDVFYGELETAPMVKECTLNIECRLVDSKELNTTELIIGEIVEVYCEEKYLSEDKPDYRKMDPMMFFMPEGPYFKAGDVIAKAFEVGKDYEK
ncbi:MAG: flavin reductase family protein [bacterium]|nr:MAG: flavin reductase family protein [bacterium]